MLAIANIVAGLTCYMARHNKWTYFAVIQLSYLVSAGVFSLFPTAVYNTFGKNHGPRVYSIILLSGSLSAIIATCIMKVLYDTMGVPI
jgi:hypothetical protein